MTDPTIICPHCQSPIHLSESLAAPLIAATRKQYEQQLQTQNAKMVAREAQLAAQQQALLQEKASLATQIEQQVQAQLQSQLQQERKRLSAEEQRKAQQAAALELAGKNHEIEALQSVLHSHEAKLAQAQQVQATLLKRQRELDDAKRELELTIEKRVHDQVHEARLKAKREAEDSLRLRVLEKDQTIAAMQQKIEELKQKAEQGSQQLQGEVQELALENLLRQRFVYDSIEPVAKGEHGGDIVQRVVASGGQACGALLWESKRTQRWSPHWLTKIREDQRNAKAEIAVLVSHALPADVHSFDVIDGVWVCSPQAALPMATVLRQSLIDIHGARAASLGQQGKTELIYQYLTGPRFRLRVEAIVEAFSTMQEDLDKERKAIMKQWAKREEQIHRVMQATVGMYGDLQGIAGKSLQEIDGLAWQALADSREVPALRKT